MNKKGSEMGLGMVIVLILLVITLLIIIPVVGSKLMLGLESLKQLIGIATPEQVKVESEVKLEDLAAEKLFDEVEVMYNNLDLGEVNHQLDSEDIKDLLDIINLYELSIQKGLKSPKLESAQTRIKELYRKIPLELLPPESSEIPQ